MSSPRVRNVLCRSRPRRPQIPRARPSPTRPRAALSTAPPDCPCGPAHTPARTIAECLQKAKLELGVEAMIVSKKTFRKGRFPRSLGWAGDGRSHIRHVSPRPPRPAVVPTSIIFNPVETDKSAAPIAENTRCARFVFAETRSADHEPYRERAEPSGKRRGENPERVRDHSRRGTHSRRCRRASPIRAAASRRRDQQRQA